RGWGSSDQTNGSGAQDMAALDSCSAFAQLIRLGSLLVMFSFSVLMGPINHIKHFVSTDASPSQSCTSAWGSHHTHAKLLRKLTASHAKGKKDPKSLKRALWAYILFSRDRRKWI
ncbi:hypothetical protein H0H92_012745, partial [Tricholoma furcatifolium]